MPVIQAACLPCPRTRGLDPRGVPGLESQAAREAPAVRPGAGWGGLYAIPAVTGLLYAAAYRGLAGSPWLRLAEWAGAAATLLLFALWVAAHREAWAGRLLPTDPLPLRVVYAYLPNVPGAPAPHPGPPEAPPPSPLPAPSPLPVGAARP